MAEARDWRSLFQERRTGVLVALIAIVAGFFLIFVANNILVPGMVSQALTAYVGVFLVAAGIIFGVSTLLIPESV